ncbi:MAG: hypothetical protein Kilf2KO_28580 [Rhodospirillales bacterium]
MNKSRSGEEQVKAVLKERAEGIDVAELRRKHGTRYATHYV